MKLLLLYCIFFVSLHANEKYTINKVRILADKITILKNKNNIFFTGNVIVKEKDLKFMADKMIVKYKSKNKKEFEIDQIFAENNVVITNNNMKAVGDNGNYNFNNSLITLKDNIVLNDNLTTMYGEELIYNVDKQTAEIIGQNKKEKEKQVFIILEDADKIKENYDKK